MNATLSLPIVANPAAMHGAAEHELRQIKIHGMEILKFSKMIEK